MHPLTYTHELIIILFNVLLDIDLANKNVEHSLNLKILDLPEINVVNRKTFQESHPSAIV